MDRSPSVWRRRMASARSFLLWLGLAFCVRVGVAQAYEIEGPSMEPTLVDGRQVLALRAAYGLSVPFVPRAVASWAQPEVGDIVILRSPADGMDLVKRV